MNAETERVYEQLLLERGVVTPEQMAEVHRVQAETPPGPRTTLLDLLLDKGYGDRQKLRDLAQLAALRTGAERIAIAGFELLEKLGEGGMGAVYRARQTSVGRFVALKLMKPKLARHQRFLKRFVREARASARVQHPNIVQGIDAGCDKGYYYFAMEFIDGDTLRRFIQREGRLPEDRCIEIGLQIARALDAADEAGFVHRDVKPENILIDMSGVAKLADLGLAKSVDTTDTSVTRVGVALGTPDYISPEQARGSQEIDIRSDIYSLGATLYHTVTGTLPFDGESAPVVMSQHMTAPLEPPERRNPQVSLRFSRVIQKMMAKKADDRYQSPAELIADLERVARGEAPAVFSSVARRRRRRRAAALRPAQLRITVALALLGLIGLLVLLLAVTLVRSGRETGRPPVEAEVQFKRAAELIRSDPTNVAEITDGLTRSLEIDPAGPNAETARALLAAAREFDAATQKAEKSPADWADAAKALRRLADRSPESPYYRPGIQRYIQSTGRRLLRAARDRAALDTLKVPDALRWLDALAASDETLAAEAAARKTELDKILGDGAGYILDTFSKDAEKDAREGRYKAAIDKLRSSVPAELVTPALRELIDKRIASLQRTAAQQFNELKGYIIDSLDHDSLDMARNYLAQIQRDLDLPDLKSDTAALEKTLSAAARFLPLLVKVDALDAASPRDEKAVAEAAAAVATEFGQDPYVARRIKKYEPLIRQLNNSDLAAKLKAIDDAVAQKKFAEADDLIAEMLKRPALTDDQRGRLLELRTQFDGTYRLARLFSDALQGRLPAADVPVYLNEKGDAITCRITAASRDSLALDTPTGHLEIRWDKLGWRALDGLATGPLKLVKDDDAHGLHLLGTLCFGNDDRESRRLLQAAIDLAEKRTDAELPGRAALLASAKDLLARLREADAEAAFKQLAELVKAADATAPLDKATAAWDQFRKQHADTQYAKKNAEPLKQLGSDLAEAVMRVNAGPVAQYVRNSEWAKVVEKLEPALDQAAKVAPLPDKSRRSVDELIRFGKAFLAEEFLYREIFSTRPWRASRAVALKRHETKTVADRADRYSKIFDIRVNALRDVDQQRRFAVVEQRGPVAVPVTDVDTRLARYNAVLDFWSKERDACIWTEIDAAREIRNTGYGGDMMSIIMLENLLKTRRGLSKDMRASADIERLVSYSRNGQNAPTIRGAVIAQAKQFMLDYAGVGEFTARFCLMTADEYEAAGDDENALKFFEKLIDPRLKFKNYAWHGYLGRGRTRERQAQFAQALADYETALRSSSNWPDGFRCARAITDLCIRSGKLDRPDRADRAVSEVLTRAGNPGETDQTRRLLDKK